jgi:electron transfer flavoprotein beta subunit
MKMVVLLKEVPDTWGDRTLDLETGLTDRSVSKAVPDEIGERALEVALAHADDNPDDEVVVIGMGPAAATTTLRKGLSMGAARAVHVLDDGLIGADLSLTAEVLAAAIRRAGADLVIAGNLSTDGSGGVIPAMVAELLDLPHATNLDSVEIGDGRVRGVRATDGGTVDVETTLPAVISITERLPDARFPSFKGIMSAKKKPFETVSLADLAIDPDDPAAARSVVIGLSERPPRAAGTKVVDEGDAAEQLVSYLVANRLA